ncbi:MAG TPA: fatty acid desaturase [Kineosporiaceae bacterium]|nr:fatty acid desaturase [Kineosporiaceae bacterium]
MTSATHRSDHEAPLTGARRAEAIAAVRRQVSADGLNHADGAYALLRGLLLLAALAPTTVLVLRTGTWWAWTVHVVVATGVLCTLPSVYHECTHGNLSRSRPLNDAVGTIAGALHLTPFATWRYFHLAHHANTGTDDDPEVYPALWSRWTMLSFPLAQWSFIRILWEWTVAAIRGGGPIWVRSERQRAAIRVNALVTVLFWLALAAVAVLDIRVVGLLVVPSVLSLMVASLTLVPEHFPAYRVGPGPADQLDRTSTFRSNAVLRLVLWNSNYHAAHHFAPKVPAHHLGTIDGMLSGIQDPRWRWTGYVRWYRERLRQLSWTPLDITAPEAPVKTGAR